MVVAGKRDGAEGLLLHAVFVHEAGDAHGERLRRRHEAVRRGKRHRPGEDAGLRALAEAAELALGEATVGNGDIAVASGDSCSGVGYRP